MAEEFDLVFLLFGECGKIFGDKFLGGHTNGDGENADKCDAKLQIIFDLSKSVRFFWKRVGD